MSTSQNRTEGYFGVGKRLLSIRETADYLGVKVKTIYNMRYQHQGPDYVMINGSPKYEPEALERYINANRVKISA